MKLYNEKITLTRNNRGVYCIDPSIGCYEGTLDNKNGCYDDCYSAKIAKRYGYDFSKTIERKFENKKHINSILNKIKK